MNFDYASKNLGKQPFASSIQTVETYLQAQMQGILIS